MKKNVHTGKKARILPYMLTALMVFMQPYSVLAAETQLPADEEDVAGEEASGADSTEKENGPSEGTDVQDAYGTASAKYIIAFEALAEEEAYYPCMYKPMQEELFGVFPETLSVWLEGEETPAELDVTWECETDYTATKQQYYVFYPKWDETQYGIADAVRDSIEIPVITIEVPTESGSIKNPEEAKSSLQGIIQGKAVLASVYLCDTYEIKAGPSPDSETVQTVVSGQSVQITGVESDGYGMIWYQVLMYRNGTAYTGYVEKTYLATSDEDFAKWEEAYLDMSAVPMTMELSEGCPDIDQFPASYQNALYALKEKHPDWTFVRMNTGLDWNTVIANEMGEKSLISSFRAGSWQSGPHSQKGWSYASEGILKYYMDPRNFLAEPYIFQFEQLIYNSSYHTADAVQEMLNDSFMASAIPDDGRTYAQVFTAIGQEIGVSPFHLASRVLQEQGPKGTSALISGTSPGYEGYYNFFNVGASGKTIEEVIANGLKRAVKEGWNSRYASLRGGAYIIGNQYILCEQDTLYLEKFNVSSGKYPNYTHQYMQNIEAPYSESSKIYRAYSKAGVLERKFVFKIPVYENMPASACAQPEKTDVLTLDKTVVSGLEVDKSVTLIPYINGSKVDHVNDMAFASSNTAVAAVDAQGKVTALSPGDATISCTRSGATTANCTVTVVKGRPTVQTPVLSPITYRDGLKLSDVILPSGWEWADGDVLIAVGTPVYPAVYTPADITKYNTVTKDISFTVTKAIPVCRVPSGIEAQSGAKLGNISLPVGFSWESDAETVLNSAGEYTFYVSYNPDENNYYTVNHIPIIIQVKETVTEPPAGGSTSMGSTSTGSTSTGSTSSGSTSAGSTSTGSTPSGSTSAGSTSTGSTSSGSTSSGSTTTGSTSAGSTSTGSTSTGSTSTGSTTTGSTSAGSTSTGSTSTGSTSSGSTTTGNTSSGSTSAGSTSAGSTSSGSTSAGSTPTGGTTGSTSTGGTANGNPQPPVSSGSGAGGSVQPPVPSGGTNSTGTQTGASPSGNPQPEDNNGNITPSGDASSGGQPADQTSGSESSESASGANSPDRNAQQNAPGTGGEAQISTTGSNNAGHEGENGLFPEGGTEETGSSDGTDYYRPAVTIQMEDTTILTPEKMQMAREQNFDLFLDMGGAVTWSIDVDTIDESVMTEVDMGVTLGTENVPQEIISTILDGNKYLELTLAHQGAFGFEPVLNIAIGKEYSGLYANLFYYDPEKESLEFICDAVIGPDGVASLRFEHASCYLVVVSEQSMSGVSFDDESANPVTRRIIAGVLVCMVMVVIGYGIFYFLKKKREEDDDEDDYGEYEEPDGDIEYMKLEDDGDNDIEYMELEDDGDDDIEYMELDNGKNDVRYMESDDDEYEEPEDEDENGGYGEPEDEDEDNEYGEPDDEDEDNGYGEPDDEDDWIEDEDWQEPDQKDSGSMVREIQKAQDWPDEEMNAEDDWIEDDEWLE